MGAEISVHDRIPPNQWRGKPYITAWKVIGDTFPEFKLGREGRFIFSVERARRLLGKGAFGSAGLFNFRVAYRSNKGVEPRFEWVGVLKLVTLDWAFEREALISYVVTACMTMPDREPTAFGRVTTPHLAVTCAARVIDKRGAHAMGIPTEGEVSGLVVQTLQSETDAEQLRAVMHKMRKMWRDSDDFYARVEAYMRPVLFQICHGLVALHACNVLHRDLHESNVVIGTTSHRIGYATAAGKHYVIGNKGPQAVDIATIIDFGVGGFIETEGGIEVKNRFGNIYIRPPELVFDIQSVFDADAPREAIILLQKYQSGEGSRADRAKMLDLFREVVGTEPSGALFTQETDVYFVGMLAFKSVMRGKHVFATMSEGAENLIPVFQHVFAAFHEELHDRKRVEHAWSHLLGDFIEPKALAEYTVALLKWHGLERFKAFLEPRKAFNQHAALILATIDLMNEDELGIVRVPNLETTPIRRNAPGLHQFIYHTMRLDPHKRLGGPKASRWLRTSVLLDHPFFEPLLSNEEVETEFNADFFSVSEAMANAMRARVVDRFGKELTKRGPEIADTWIPRMARAC